MHRTAFRGLYGGNNNKTKSQAVISPGVDDMDTYERGDASTGEEGDSFGSLRHNSNNGDTAIDIHGATVALKIHDVPEDGEYQLQRKSISTNNDARMLNRLGVGQFFGDRGSNQEQDNYTGPLGQKYTVLGQKQQWRKNRAGRSRQLQTISPVDDTQLRADSGAYSSGRGSAVPSSTSSFYESRSSQEPSTASFREGTSSIESSSSCHESDYSEGRSQGESTSGGDGSQRFIVTRQKNAKYSAKLQLTGQKPLYLGRYKNEAAALAACENAYSVISTPRK
ncbi:hypothetical protein P3T76_003062 [Phytophthora citrophthora]|uniref:Uncharacterized protein n=1 Tax=Phytophthora citrophthora TaxID=4793 RepID=A0AAD9LTE1_9STRA|nr:hypothetical protein P3T76_003062 [Phytophthora citrophthora]